MRRLARVGLLFFILAGIFSASAHQLSNTYLILEVTNGEIAGRWEIAMKDLLHAQGAAAYEAAMTNTEPSDPKVALERAGVLSHLKLRVDGAAAGLKPVDYSTEMFPDGAFAVVYFQTATPTNAKALEVEYSLFFDIDPSHRGLLKLLAGEKTMSAVFDPAHAKQTFTLGKPDGAGNFLGFIRLGVFHIWTGIDHILFLLALLFPSVLRWQNGKWEVSTTFRACFVNVLKVVTAFTLAHSITLSLAAFKVVELDSRLVETTIAVSVALAALNNIFAVLPDFGWVIAFCFGFVHGFGFATVLGELGLEHRQLVAPLVGFNLGVELGQLAIVGLFLPFAFKLRPTRFYKVGVLRLGSLVIVALAGIWAWERMFGRKLLPF